MGMSRAERRRLKREGKRRRVENESRRIADVYPVPDVSRQPVRRPEQSPSCEETGHPEQFMALLEGIPPHKCPQCGETPVFGPITQNVDPNMPGYVEDDD